MRHSQHIGGRYIWQRLQIKSSSGDVCEIILCSRSPKSKTLVAPLDRGEKYTGNCAPKAVISDTDSDMKGPEVFSGALALHSVACIAFEFGKFGTTACFVSQ